MAQKTQRRSSHLRPSVDRSRFWEYCQRAANNARVRTINLSLPSCDIDAYAIDELLVSQGWRCAISGVELAPPATIRDPFGPSIDRIVPSLGYTRGNVRVICNMVNFAMNNWGVEALEKLVRAMNARPSPSPHHTGGGG